MDRLWKNPQSPRRSRDKFYGFPNAIHRVWGAFDRAPSPTDGTLNPSAGSGGPLRLGVAPQAEALISSRHQPRRGAASRDDMIQRGMSLRVAAPLRG